MEEQRFVEIMDRVTRFAATFGYLGFLPKAPGTYASLAAVMLAWTGEGILFHLVLFLSVIGFLCATQAERIFASKDPSVFVLDEVCGMMLAVLWLPKSVILYGAAFALFRAFDILKPGPVGWAERKTGSGGILWDDLAAGALTNLILQFFTRFVI